MHVIVIVSCSHHRCGKLSGGLFNQNLDRGNGISIQRSFKHFATEGNARCWSTGIQLQHQTREDCHQVQKPLGFHSGHPVNVKGSVQTDQCLSTPRDFPLPILQAQEGDISAFLITPNRPRGTRYILRLLARICGLLCIVQAFCPKGPCSILLFGNWQLRHGYLLIPWS